MTWTDALPLIAAHRAAPRLAELCRDDSDPERRDAYRALVVRMAGGEPEGEARPSVDESVALVRRMRACPYRSTEGCGCAGARCALRPISVNHRDCFECLERYPEG